MNRSFLRGMTGTALLTAGLTLLFALLHTFLSEKAFLPLAITCGTVCYHFSMRLLVGYACRYGIRKPLDPENRWFRQKSFEPRLYKALGVRRWKDRVPTFRPADFAADQPLSTLLQTMCISELVHELIVLFSFVPLAFVPLFGSFWVFLLTSLASALLDCLFILLQRYNRPRVLALAKRKKLAPTRGM